MPCAAPETPGASAQRPSLGELLRQLAGNISELLRSEVELAKKEMLDKLKIFRAAAIVMAVGALLGILGLFMLSAAAFIGLAAYLGYGMSALALGILLVVVGAILVFSAFQKFRTTSLKPQQTIETLKENREWLRELT